MESMAASLEAENRSKQESLRQNKKLESDINELEVSLDQANRTLADYQRTITRQEDQIRVRLQDLYVDRENRIWKTRQLNVFTFFLQFPSLMNASPISP